LIRFAALDPREISRPRLKKKGVTPKRRAGGKQALLKNKKEEQGGKPCSRNCVDPVSRLILDLIERATLLVRVRAPPETWTTSLSSDSLSLNW
jgi:hypothetical protein